MIGNPYFITSLLLLAASAGRGQILPPSAVIRSTAIDANGSIYIGGEISAENLPATNGAFQPRPPKECRASPNPTRCLHGFLAKVAASGDVLEWATYLSGDGDDAILALAVGPDGNLVMTGSTTSVALLPVGGGYRTTPGPIFIAKLSPDGKSLVAGTYFGGDSSDAVRALKLDASGNVYIAGDAVSPAFPTTPGVVQTVRDTGPPPPGYNLPGNCVDPSDQFVAKFDSSLRSLVFSTLIGSSVRETTGDLALGADGTIFVAGTRGPELSDGMCPTHHLLTRLRPDASSAIYTARIPEDWTRTYPWSRTAVAVDSSGFAYFGTDNSQRILAPPLGAITKFDPQGKKVASAGINGHLISLAANERGEVVALGRAAADGGLSPTAGLRRYCGSHLLRSPYVARWEASTLALSYSAYLQHSQAWLAGAERIVAQNPQGGFPTIAVIPAGPPAPGTIECVANAASYNGEGISPGEILTMFGPRIGPDQPMPGMLDAQGNFTSSLGETRVLIDGIAAPLLYAGPDQINLVAPFALPGAGSVRMELYRGGSLVRSFAQRLVRTKPGIFTLDSTGRGALAALNQDWSVNTPANMASPGDVVSIFVTGLGAMTPQPVDGSRPLEPVNKPVLPVQVFANSQPAEILYAGNAPALVQGVVQVNFRLPDPIVRSTFGDPNAVHVRVENEDGGSNVGITEVFIYVR